VVVIVAPELPHTVEELALSTPEELKDMAGIPMQSDESSPTRIAAHQLLSKSRIATLLLETKDWRGWGRASIECLQLEKKYESPCSLVIGH